MIERRTPVSAPPRIESEPGALGELVRAARRYEPRLDQSAAFADLVERARGRRERSWRAPAWALGFATACAVSAIAVFSIRDLDVPQHAALGTVVPEPQRAQAPPSNEERPDDPDRPERPVTRVLPAGETRLDDGTRVRLAEASAARVEDAPGGVRVGLQQGTITVDVARQPEGRAFEVHAGAYRFVALGTSFSVSASGDRVELGVFEGRVAVLRDSSELARVGAGEVWTPSRETPAPRAPEAATRSRTGAEVDTPRDENCLALARSRRARDAERCFEAQAARGGLGAEMALFELARLRSDVLGDPAGALAALKKYRERFPNGSLSAEVDVSRVHLLARLGRHDELVSESARLLGGSTGRERGAELRMLRANALRTGLKDFRGAEREYAEVEKARGKFAAEASFYRGVCLEALGDTSGAARAYRRYLEVPGRPREAEALQRLKALAQP